MGRPRHKRDLIRISTHIPKRVYDLLKDISEEEDLSLAQIIRRAIDMYLFSQENLLNIEESDLELANYESETRTKKALLLNQTRIFDRDINQESSLFEELNPDYSNKNKNIKDE